VAKAERYAELAAERIAEEAQAKGKSVSEVTEIVSQATAKHLIVLGKEKFLSRKFPKKRKLESLK